ncbi:MAG: NAD(P)/FAD-dependent oxidoreductase [Bdellovibrionota bacterium]
MRKVTIAGCGLVGSLWAYLLKKQGYDVEVFEKRSDPRKAAQQAGRSINLVITSRGLYALETAGLLNKILPITVPVYGRRIHPINGDTFFQAYGRDNTECNYSVSRSVLNCALIEQCEEIGVRINFEHVVQNIDIEKKQLSFNFKNENKIHNYDLLFATDGSGSNVRKALTTKYPDRFKEQTDWLSSGYKELYMPAASNGLQALEKNSLHIWPRATHMMMGLANLDGSFTMTLYLPNTDFKYSLDNIKTNDDIKNLFQNEFATAIPYMPNYLGDYQNNPQGALGTVRMNTWVHQDSIALMGDAAHAIVPFFGQGMNLGFEDCTTMLNLLKTHQGDWSRTLTSYDQQQRPNANAIADMALENFIEMRDKVSDPKFQFKKKIEAVIEKEFPDLYRSRYGMITYTLIPYLVAQEAGVRQSEILDALAVNLKDPAQLDLDMVKMILSTKFYPWLKQKGFSTDRYLTKH